MRTGVNGTLLAAPALLPVEGGPSPLHLLSTSAAATLGLVLNAYILTVLLWQRQFRTANNLLLLHLAFVDSLLCLLVLGSNVLFAALDEPEAQAGACQTQGTLWAAVPTVLVWTLCGLSCDRYAAIASPLHYSRLVNTRRTCVFLGSSWVLALSAAVPPLARVCPYTYRAARCVCVAQCAGNGPLELGYALSYVWLALVFPASLIAASNLQVLLIARTHRHRIVAAIYEVTLRAQATVTHQRNPWYLARFRGRSALLSTAQLLASLALLMAPHFGLLLWEAATGRRGPAAIASATTALLCWTPCAHAYVYGVRSRALRQTFKDLLRRHVYRQQVGREAARRLSTANGGYPNGRPKLIRRFSAPDGLGTTIGSTNKKRVLPRRASEKCMLVRGAVCPMTSPSSAPSSRRSLLVLDNGMTPAMASARPTSRVSVFPLILENGLSEEEELGRRGGGDDDSRSMSRATPDSTATRWVDQVAGRLAVFWASPRAASWEALERSDLHHV
ncbi:histamine H2 receptor [Ixodes scapularis]|uniref:histamine H2 receptor n=1 Tax=Ixodes scapularis TaxID=6945 RepID=UPI00116164DB|nr:histamine H2 receptor [Ixodes scapularis]